MDIQDSTLADDPWSHCFHRRIFPRHFRQWLTLARHIFQPKKVLDRLQRRSATPEETLENSTTERQTHMRLKSIGMTALTVVGVLIVINFVKPNLPAGIRRLLG